MKKNRMFYNFILSAVVLAVSILALSCVTTSSGDDDAGGDMDFDDDSTTLCKSYQDGCCVTGDDCAKGSCRENVCIIKPMSNATVWYEDSVYDPEDGEKVGEYIQIFENGQPAKPDLSCIGDYEDREDADGDQEDGDGDQENIKDVTVNATIKVFGVEANCISIKVEVFTMRDESKNIRSSFQSSESVADAFVTENPDENYECHLNIEDVPVGKWLVFKTYDEGNVDFRDTYQWNMYIILPEGFEEGDIYDMEINAISQTSWSLIPLTLGLTNGIRTGFAALSGSIKDCRGRIIKDATVGFDILPTKRGYFNANVSDLLPDTSKNASNSDGTFAAVDMPTQQPEPVKIVSLVMVNDEVKIMSEFKVVVVPDSVTIYGIHGAEPANIHMYEHESVK